LIFTEFLHSLKVEIDQINKIQSPWFHVKSEWQKILKFPHSVESVLLRTTIKLWQKMIWCSFYPFFQSYRSKSKLFSPSVSTSDDLQCPIPNAGGGQAMLSQSLSVGGLQSNTPSLAALHSNSCGSPNNFSNLSSRELSNSTESSLKVAKSGKPTNRWSGLWGSSSKVCDIWITGLTHSTFQVLLTG